MASPCDVSPAPRRVAILALVACAVFLCAAEKLRPMPFNRNNVYAYFKRVEELKRGFPAHLPEDAFIEETCRAHVTAMTGRGYDFNATVGRALAGMPRTMRNLDSPRFTFLAGAFSIHPKHYLKRKLISRENYDGLMELFAE